MNKIAFWATLWAYHGQHKRSEKMPVLLVKHRISVSEPPLGGAGLTVTYAIHLQLVEKLLIDFL